MPIIHLMHGFIGAGKTTFSKKLEAEKNAVRYSPDEWMIERHGINPPAEAFDAYLAIVKEDIIRAATAMLSEGRDVIFDYGFWRYEDRRKYRALADDLKVPYILYFIQAGWKTMEERALKRTQEMPAGALVIDKNAIEMLRAQFEPLRNDEDHIVIVTE